MVDISALFGQKKADIEKLTAAKDISGLIRALHSSDDLYTQSQAAKALGSLGPAAMDALIRALKKKNKASRLVIIQALTEIRDPKSIPVLIETLKDESSEIRWEATIALGEIGDPQAIEPLITCLRDHDKHVRYGAAFSLVRIGWKPPNDEEKAFLFVGMQEWKATWLIGDSAIPALTHILHDRDSNVRIRAVESLGELKSTQATPALIQSLADENSEVRWNAVLASQKCGIKLMYLPRGLSRRPKLKKNPLISGFLNFMLPGLGYSYLGKWWGVMIFEIDIFGTVWAFKYLGEEFTYEALLPIYLLLALHGYYFTTKMPESSI
jgi:HEAT repeat protein